MSKNAEKQYFKNVWKVGIMNDKKFWPTIKPFLISKRVFAEHQINIKDWFKKLLDLRVS